LCPVPAWDEGHAAIKTIPDFRYETDLMAAGARIVAGVDEVGRGPLAGPVTAAAVILDPSRIPPGLNDSKALSAARREALFSELEQVAQIGIGWASVSEIDAINIRNAAFLAMRRAVEALPIAPDHVLVDGNACPPICPARPHRW
jgi:ribonuclease HII